jgi:hypothetical protein
LHLKDLRTAPLTPIDQNNKAYFTTKGNNGGRNNALTPSTHMHLLKDLKTVNWLGKPTRIFGLKHGKHYKTMCAGYQIIALTKMTQSPSSTKQVYN